MLEKRSGSSSGPDFFLPKICFSLKKYFFFLKENVEPVSQPPILRKEALSRPVVDSLSSLDINTPHTDVHTGSSKQQQPMSKDPEGSLSREVISELRQMNSRYSC